MKRLRPVSSCTEAAHPSLFMRPGAHRDVSDNVRIARRKHAHITRLFGPIDFDPKYNYKKQRRRR